MKCQGLKKDRTKCNNTAQRDSLVCWAHRDQAAHITVYNRTDEVDDEGEEGVTTQPGLVTKDAPVQDGAADLDSRHVVVHYPDNHSLSPSVREGSGAPPDESPSHRTAWVHQTASAPRVPLQSVGTYPTGSNPRPEARDTTVGRSERQVQFARAGSAPEGEPLEPSAFSEARNRILRSASTHAPAPPDRRSGNWIRREIESDGQSIEELQEMLGGLSLGVRQMQAKLKEMRMLSGRPWGGEK